jgi:hypothetical protein
VRSRRRPRIAAAGRLAAGFALGLAVWAGFRAPYERLLAASGEAIARAFERPPVTRLAASEGEILVERSDFPPAAARPGLPAADLHFNFVLLAALFALDRRPLETARVAAFAKAAALLFALQVAALTLQVRSLYATGLGDWSAARYGPFARNAWAGAFHFYAIAGRFAAPFALWWFFRREEDEEGGRGRRKGQPLRWRSRRRNR